MFRPLLPGRAGMGSGELRRKYIILNLMLLINRGSELRGFSSLYGT